jgi:hypothetical protein
MTHDSLIVSRIVNIPQKDVSCVCKMYSPSILTVNTEISKRSAKFNVHEFYPKNFNHPFLPKPELDS